MEREVRRLEGLRQLGFDFCAPATVDESDPPQAGGGEVFLDAEPRELFVGASLGCKSGRQASPMMMPPLLNHALAAAMGS